jgi:superfamily I DNA/RNA helicase
MRQSDSIARAQYAMPTSVFVTKQFIDDLDGLTKALRKRFARSAPIFSVNPHDAQLDTEKLHARIGTADAYSCRLNKAYRYVWTNELTPYPTLRLVGAHDATYRRAEKMPPLQQDKVRPLEEALQKSRKIKNSSQGSVAEEPAKDQANHTEQTPEDVYQFSSSDFQSLLEGNIAAWMLFMPSAHSSFVRRTFGGPARVTGPSGSGKTALLLHRARHEAQFRKDAQVLIVCFNVALAQVLSGLLDRLCGDEWEERARIRVSHLDRLAMDICGQPTVTTYKQQMLEEACKRVKPERLLLHFGQNTIAFLDRELSVWLKGNPDISYDTYRNLKFPTSHVALSPEEREEVLRVAGEYERIKGTAIDWEDLRNQALAKISNSETHSLSKITAVLVDEYQDFSVSALKLIMGISRPAGQNVFFCGDERQRIYCSNSSFRQLGIEVRGRALTLATNYRNTRQIAEVAAHLTRAIEADESEGTLPANRIAYPDLDGPLPVVAGFSNQEDETVWISEEITKLLAEGYLPGEIGVLAPNWNLQNACAVVLRSKQIPHFVLKGESASRFFDETAVKLSTYHQAKGLEYKVVFCSGLSSAVFRKEYRYSGMEGQAVLGSLVYMAVTRARDRLFLSFAGTPLKWLCTLDHSLVDLQKEADLMIVSGLERLDTTMRVAAHTQGTLL